MTTRRTRTDAPPNLADLESASNPVDVPGVMPPPGVQARVRTTVDYDRIVEPEGSMSDYGNDLRELAANEIDDDDLPEPNPQDPYSEFVNTWRKYHGYPLKIVRLPDPADKRMPGHTYSSPCFELTMLSDMPFDPNNLIGMLQVINNNSGGVFRIFLTDEYGRAIPGARLDRLVIADPPKQYNPQQQPRDDYERDRDRYYRREREPAPAPPVKSETEQYIETMQRELFQKVMMRALDPPTPPPVDPLSSLPTDTRLALGLLEKGDILSNVVDRITNLAQAPERIESSTWKDKLAEAGVNLVANNPEIITTVTNIISRATIAVATALAPRRDAQVVSEPIPVQPIRHPPAQRSAAQMRPPQAEVNTGLPEAPQPDDLDDIEQDEIDMMEQITQLLLSDKPLSLTDPVITDLREQYPGKFEAALRGLAATPSMIIIQYLCGKSEFCADMFNSPRNGPHLKARLEELKTLIKASGLLPPEVAQAIDAQQETQQAETEPAS